MRIYPRKSLLALFMLLMAACNSSVPGYGPAGNRGADASVDDSDSDDEGEEDTGDDTTPPDTTLEIQVTPTTLALAPGETAKATATVTSQGQPDQSPVSWLSANEQIAIVDNTGLIRAMGDGEVEIIAEVGANSASVVVTVSSTADCVAGTGNNGDSCADIYQGQDIWRCTVSPAQGNKTVSQVCRDQGTGPKWITFHINPTDCCACDGAFNVGCCTTNSGSTGCP